MEITKLYTVKEVADILRVKVTTIRTGINNGKIKATKTIGGWRITEEEVERLVKGE